MPPFTSFILVRVIARPVPRETERRGHDDDGEYDEYYQPTGSQYANTAR